MARVLLVALAWCAVRGEDYSGGAMPQYGEYEAPSGTALADYYRGHASDAPASLDYKYEEAQSDTEKPPKYEQIEHWQRADRESRPSWRYKGYVDDEFDSEADKRNIKSKRQHWRRRHRSRNNLRQDPQLARRYGPAYRRRNEDYGPGSDHGMVDANEPDYVQENEHQNKENKYHDDEDLVGSQPTTAKVIRRKPRDRIYAPPILDSPTISDDNDSAGERTPKDEWDGNRNRLAKIPPEGSELESDSEFDAKSRINSKFKNDIAYGDYYDMKRVNNIKNKLTTLLHRSTATRSVKLRTPSDLVKALYHRRAGESQVRDDGTTMDSSDYSANHSDDDYEEFSTQSSFKDILSTGRSNHDDTPTRISEHYQPTRRSDINLTTLIQPTSTIKLDSKTSITTDDGVTTENTTELFLREKFLLSISKKEMEQKVRSEWSKKPPVLLRIMDKAAPATVVMVEPGTTESPWMRAREVADDEPATLDKVKRLMRLKLVANSKSFRDLTDDWDEMICDYIDMGSIDQLSASPVWACPCNFLIAVNLFFLFALLCYV